ncbi:hypothetical protein C1646_766903 [Rhizophagus diaphanus]|nr:hypothetical protein C1646_766903 [Rhizophagus diaphanus] [Rhizophagus sp. MUCL 43196]
MKTICRLQEDHNQGKQDLIEDLSCIDCYSEDQNLELLENSKFREFWQFIISPRYPDIIPSFDTLIEIIQFYWEVTDRFNNWEAYYSDQSSNTANKAWQDQRNEEGENEETESIISQEMILKNKEGGYSHIGIADTSNDHIYDPKKNEKEKQKVKTSGSSNKWNTGLFSTYKPYSDTGVSSNLKSFVTTKPFQSSFSSSSIRTSILKTPRHDDFLNFSNDNLQDEEESEEQEAPLSEREQNKIMLQFFQQAQKFYAKEVESRESRLVDFPVFKKGNQDPVEWLEAFSQACMANRIGEERAIVLVASYLKGTALTWYKHQTITSWENDNNPQHLFVHLFKDHFCLRPEFVVPVQLAMPQTVEEAMEKAQALETAFSMGMDLSPAYSMNYSQPESVEKMVERKISEGITAALSQMRTEVKPTNSAPNNNNNNNQSRNNSGCFVCERTGHIAKNCHQRNNQQNNNNHNNNGRDLRNVDCYNYGRKDHVFRNCRSSPLNNNNNNDSRTNNVNWKESLEEIRPIEKPMQLLKRPTYMMYNLWQVAGGKVENCESSIQAVLRETKEETALDIKKDECIFLFNDPAFNCDRTEPEKQEAWTITSFEQFQFIAKYNELIPTLVNYCDNILNQLTREKPAYLNQKEKAEEALYGEAIVYEQPVTVAPP